MVTGLIVGFDRSSLHDDALLQISVETRVVKADFLKAVREAVA